MGDLTLEGLVYAACVYGFSLQPLPWQGDYTWYDYLADSDFGVRFGLVGAPFSGETAVSMEQAAREYRKLMPLVEEEGGLIPFYDKVFGHLYNS